MAASASACAPRGPCPASCCMPVWRAGRAEPPTSAAAAPAALRSSLPGSAGRPCRALGASSACAAAGTGGCCSGSCTANRRCAAWVACSRAAAASVCCGAASPGRMPSSSYSSSSTASSLGASLAPVEDALRPGPAARWVASAASGVTAKDARSSSGRARSSCGVERALPLGLRLRDRTLLAATPCSPLAVVPAACSQGT